jgi:hypothetical protein
MGALDVLASPCSVSPLRSDCPSITLDHTCAFLFCSGDTSTSSYFALAQFTAELSLGPIPTGIIFVLVTPFFCCFSCATLTCRTNASLRENSLVHVEHLKSVLVWLLICLCRSCRRWNDAVHRIIPVSERLVVDKSVGEVVRGRGDRRG